MQKAIIIQAGGALYTELDNSELNKYLADGWRVQQIAPFGCSGSGMQDISPTEQRCAGYCAAILVIIEK
ncbi:MAG: hypothetical protein WCJ97_03610 [Phycisphaerae bacterium]